MFLAFDRRRSVTGHGGDTNPMEFDRKYHDFHRGWVVRGLQNSAKAAAGTRFTVSPDFNGEGIFPRSAKESGRSWVHSDPRESIYHPLLRDWWAQFLSFTCASHCVSLEFNIARALRIVVASRAVDFIKGCTDVSNDAARMADAQEDLPGATVVVEWVIPFGFNFNRAKYEQLEQDVLDRLCEILDAISSRA